MQSKTTRMDPPTVPNNPEDESRIIVRGGRELRGSVRVGGAKNAVLKMMAAALLSKETTVLRNVPNLTDVHMMAQVLRHLGAKVTIDKDQVAIDAKDVHDWEAPYELVSHLRASFVVLGPLLARFREAKVSLPGGCAIGERKIDLHERGLKVLGCDVRIDHGYVTASAKQLVGGRIYLERPSNGATENIMLAAVCAEGTTVIENAAQDPEILNLAQCVNEMGGNIQGAGTYQIVIEGVPFDQMHGAVVDTIPDRVEVGTFMLACMATGGEIMIEGANAHHLYSVIHKIQEMGAEVALYAPDVIKIKCDSRKFRATDLTTLPYPGFPTDLQAPFMPILAIAEGTSIIEETIYENRFMHAAELRRMGADVVIKGNAAVVKGVEKLSGAEVKGSDLRAGAALIIAGLGAEGVTEVTGLRHLDRGYDRLEDKLRSIGAEIFRR
ncbi:MAG: UDP-N-acetylglucosamine 1-carboxyvinyltransferase [Candidatus Obscuribacterales bacterium]|nr:UDP-N-acetylglucosamine 1-carboxyvinyltransferase [Candidatus Obscuribacterales bacterium]